MANDEWIPQTPLRVDQEKTQKLDVQHRVARIEM